MRFAEGISLRTRPGFPKAKAKAAPAASRPISKPAAKLAPPESPILLVMCDLACTWKLDGETQGEIAADGSAKIHTDIGQHAISATAQDGSDVFRQDIEIKQPGQTIVHVDLSSVRAGRVQRQKQAAERAEESLQDQVRLRVKRDEEARIIWTDPATGLMWMKQDNDDDVNWHQAVDYCRSLRLGEHGGWRLPTPNELQQIYDANVEVEGKYNGKPYRWHVKGNLSLSGLPWSSSQRDVTGQAWFIYFADGEKLSDRLGTSETYRALCVRSRD